jgi:glutaconyl-CoA/methylmalonyl-CoA decarboxylase subunit gamma
LAFSLDAGSETLMLYYVSLDGREFPLTPSERSVAGRSRLKGAAGDIEVQILSHPAHGRPALILVDGAVYRVRAAAGLTGASARRADESQRALINGQPIRVTVETALERRARPDRSKAIAAGSRVLAPMPGRVVKVNVRAGEVVAAGAPLLGIEAMKMENELLAPSAGKVVSVAVQVGSTVEADQELIVIEPA